MDRLTVDVVIVGGGPAGASAAGRLAQLGYRVCLVERGPAQGNLFGESLAPTAMSMLEALGVREAVERASFRTVERVRLRWTQSTAIDTQRTSLVVERGDFDRLLRRSAARAGAIVLEPARAGRPLSDAAVWRVPIRCSASTLMVEGRFLVNASGRRSAGMRSGPRLAALCGRWWHADMIPEMRIEAGDRCWLWSAPMSDGSITALACLDPKNCAGLTRRDREALYRSLLGASTLMARCLNGSLVGGVLVRDATPRVCEAPITPTSIRIGDAALGLDPLSGQGVQSALRSGLQAGVVVHTILSGLDVDAAISFYRGALAATEARHRAVAAQFYDSQSVFKSPFWSERSGGAKTEASSAETAAPPSLSAVLRLSRDAQLLPIPAIDGDVIRRRLALSHPNLDRPVVWFGGLAIGPALAALSDGRTAASVLADWSRLVPPRVAWEILLQLTAHGIVTGV
jgi:2-polyprenyl-6-methoxyphenol hydroxylase-like FAD-dependent oxidoreductase